MSKNIPPVKILFYLDPWIEKGSPGWKDSWAPLYIDYINVLRKASKAGFEFVVITGKPQLSFFEPQFEFEDINILVVEQSELREVFSNSSEAQDAWYKNKYTSAQLESMISLLFPKLGEFKPDVIWSFVSAVPFLIEMFPDAMLINQELGMLGRSPLPITWYLDPYGTFSNSFIAKHSNELKCSTINRKQQVFVDEIRYLYLSAIRSGQKLTRNDLDPKNQYRKILLLPLQYSGHFVFDSMCEYRSQFDFLLDVMSKVPKDIGVVVTEHKNPVSDPVLNDDVISFMSQNYSNFIHSDKLDIYTNSSLMILDLVDGVISVSSTLGFQSMFLGKCLFSVGKSQLSPYSSVGRLEDIGYYFDNESELYENRDAVIYYFLTRYYIPNEYLLNGQWLKLFINKSCLKNEGGCEGLNFYEPIATDEELLRFYKKNSQSRLMANVVAKDDSGLVSEAEVPFVSKYKKRISQLISKNNELTHSIEALKESTSWRITKPVRVIKRFISK